MLNFLKMCTRAILISSWASLMPTQLRGPAPNGKYTNGCLLALASGVNLEESGEERRGINLGPYSHSRRGEPMDTKINANVYIVVATVGFQSKSKELKGQSGHN